MKNLKLSGYIFLSLILIAFSASFAQKNTDSKKNSTAEYEQGKKLYDEKKYNEAFPLLLKAAEAGHSDAQMHVGKMYYNGWGVAHSHEKGRAWHEKAARQGNKESIQKIYNMDHRSGPAH